MALSPHYYTDPGEILNITKLDLKESDNHENISAVT